MHLKFSRYFLSISVLKDSICHAPPDEGGGGCSHGQYTQRTWVFYPMRMMLVSPRGHQVILSAKEMRLIVYLLSRDPLPVMREEFAVLIGGTPDKARRIDATIYRLRYKIKQETGLAAPISTLYGQGYKNTGIVVNGQLPDFN